jgi:serine/threonine protein kinase
MSCDVCGLAGAQQCGDCGLGYYCTELHQRIDWNHRHRYICGKDDYGTPPDDDTLLQTAFDTWDIDKTAYLKLPIPITRVWLGKLVGQGGFGKIYEACADLDCEKRVAVKIEAIGDAYDKAQFEKAAMIGKLMDYARVGPKVFFTDVFTAKEISAIIHLRPPQKTPQYGITVMELYDASLARVTDEGIKENYTFLQRTLSERVKRMHKHIMHNDLSFRNILVRIKQTSARFSITDAVIADFGLSLWRYENLAIALKENENLVENAIISYIHNCGMNPNIHKLTAADTEAIVNSGIFEDDEKLYFINLATYLQSTDRPASSQRKRLQAPFLRRFTKNPLLVDAYLLRALAYKVK